MSTSSSKKSLFWGLFLLMMMVAGIYFVSQWFVGKLAAVDAKLAAALLTASATVIVTVFSVLISKHLENRTAIEAALREKKEPIYQKLIDFVFNITFATKLGKEMPSEKEILQFLADMTRDLVVWGSPEVITEFSRFKNSKLTQVGDGDSSGGAFDLLFSMEEVFKAIRKDLGHKDLILKKGDLLAMYITDINEYR